MMLECQRSYPAGLQRVLVPGREPLAHVRALQDPWMRPVPQDPLLWEEGWVLGAVERQAVAREPKIKFIQRLSAVMGRFINLRKREEAWQKGQRNSS